MSGAGVQGVWTPPPLDDCEEDTLRVSLDAEHLLIARRVLWEGQLVGYAIIYCRRAGDRWVEMVCIDTINHGCVHRHDGDHASPYKVLRPIREQRDVQDSYYESYDEVYNAYLISTNQEPLR